MQAEGHVQMVDTIARAEEFSCPRRGQSEAPPRISERSLSRAPESGAARR